MDSELIVSTTTDSAAIAEAAATGDETGARAPAPKPDIQQLDGSSAVSYENERSERTLLLERLAQDEADLEVLTNPDDADSEQVTSNESAPEEAEAEPEPEPENIDMEAVRRAATEDAIAAARTQYAQPQSLQPSQADLNQLRSQLAVPFAARIAELRAKTTDIAELDKQSNIPIPVAVQDALLALPGGPEAALYLVRHPEQARQLSTMPEHLAVAKVAALTARLDPAANRPVPASRASRPISPVSGSSTKSSVPLDQLDYRDFVKVREQQMKSRYRR
jgi:hypothetical protein